MEVICLDTSVLIEFYRNKEKAKSFWFALSQNYRFQIPSIVKYEILRGDKKKDAFWHHIFRFTPILSFDERCAELASEIYQDLKIHNQLIETDDILIAATAIANQLKIATINNVHFSRIKNIEIITPDNLQKWNK